MNPNGIWSQTYALFHQNRAYVSWIVWDKVGTQGKSCSLHVLLSAQSIFSIWWMIVTLHSWREYQRSCKGTNCKQVVTFSGCTLLVQYDTQNQQQPAFSAYTYSTLSWELISSLCSHTCSNILACKWTAPALYTHLYQWWFQIHTSWMKGSTTSWLSWDM